MNRCLCIYSSKFWFSCKCDDFISITNTLIAIFSDVFRLNLKKFYEKIILADPTYCAEKNPEQSLWKSVFYQMIELYRKKLEENPADKDLVKEKLSKLIAEVW